MPSFDIVKHTEIADTFRVKSVIGAFDLDNAKMDEHFQGNIDIEGKEWNVGLIVGGSGTGKTTIAREVFGNNIYCGMPHTDGAVIDDMPQGVPIGEIERMFTSVGFASPPNWLRPYSVLSNGEKMRCDLAYALLSGDDLVVYDEFTSVVNRQVAKAASFAISKCVRRNGKRFVAVSCHDDIVEWLQPDWIYNTDTKRFFLQRRVQATTDANRNIRNSGCKYKAAIMGGFPQVSLFEHRPEHHLPPVRWRDEWGVGMPYGGAANAVEEKRQTAAPFRSIARLSGYRYRNGLQECRVRHLAERGMGGADLEYHNNTSAISCAMQIPEMAVGTVRQSKPTRFIQIDENGYTKPYDKKYINKTYNILVPIRGRRTKRSDNVKRAR